MACRKGLFDGQEISALRVYLKAYDCVSAARSAAVDNSAPFRNPPAVHL